MYYILLFSTIEKISLTEYVVLHSSKSPLDGFERNWIQRPYPSTILRVVDQSITY